MSTKLGEFATGHWKGIFFMILGLCLAGIYAASSMPSSVFPQTNFPRVVLMIDNGEMPADEMMATITKPIEEAMKDVPGVVNIRSSTGRGSSVVNVFFNWQVDMEKTELHVRSRLAQVRSSLPASVDAKAYRLTFSVFPIVGISLSSKIRSVEDLTVIGDTIVKPRFLRIPGVARVDLVGGREPEFHIIADPLKLAAQNLALADVAAALEKTNLVASGGLHEEKDTLFLTLVDGRVHDISEIENLVVAVGEDHPIRVRDFARVLRAAEPAATVITSWTRPPPTKSAAPAPPASAPAAAAGKDENSVLIMVRSQPDGSTLDIADQLKREMRAIYAELPPDMKDAKLSFFYDQSLLVRDSVHSVWEAIIFGLILSVAILFLFLKDWGSTIVAIVVIPVTVLATLVAMRLFHMSFNLMTLGGIASAIGLVIDDAIVVVEAIHTKMVTGMERLKAVQVAIGEIFLPLTGSTLTPVVVFVPLAFLDGITGVFFRALAITMTVSLLMSLVLAISLTPSLAAAIIRVKPTEKGQEIEHGGPILRFVSSIYEKAARIAIRHRFITLGLCLLLGLAGYDLFIRLKSDRLPKLEERGFVLDYIVRPAGTSLSESNRSLMEIENLLKQTPEVESYSRRTGVALGLELTEPNVGDFLVKLKPDAQRSTEDVMAELRGKIALVEPQIDVDFHGMLGDLIGDLVSSPKPIEIKIYSPDVSFLEKTAGDIQKQIDEVSHVADSESGVVVAGPSLTFRVRPADAQRYGLTTTDIAEALETAKLGKLASYVLKEDRITHIRVLMDPHSVGREETLRNLPLKTASGQVVRLSQVADMIEEPGSLELQRDNLRQFIAVTAEIEGADLGSVIDDIKAKLATGPQFPPGTIEFGGIYQQQQEEFHNLMVVMILAVILIFTVLLLEFRSFLEPIAIVAGALLALLGTIAALYMTDTSQNIISRLGAIIGVGIVAKNGILMLDYVDHLRQKGLSMEEALVQSGRRRLRPVLMTSMAAALGMLPLAYGVGSGADMLRPLAISVIGALCISVLMSLVATPTFYYLMYRLTPSGFFKKPEPRP
jgi:multidrug efflux pump subunit AcrB